MLGAARTVVAMWARLQRLLMSIGVALSACTPSGQAPVVASPPPSDPATPDETPTIVTVTAPGSGERGGFIAEPIVVGWGSAGVVSSDAPVPCWVIGTLAVTTEADLSSVRLTKIEVFDADGGVPLPFGSGGPGTTSP